MSGIGKTWSAIYGQWLPSSEYQEDEMRPAIEQYPPETSRVESQVTIFVAIEPKR
jgi:predicted transcriptional regulator YdeE